VIVVDSTVWIDFFRGVDNRETRILRRLMLHNDRDFTPLVAHLGLRAL
jgi:predicted nucleic acid-binding protein